jgi:hypothetical protein
MEKVLIQTGFTYYTIDVKETPKALHFLKSRGHTVVPQLYYLNAHINTNPNTKSYTPLSLFAAISGAMEGKYPGEDSGIEE